MRPGVQRRPAEPAPRRTRSCRHAAVRSHRARTFGFGPVDKRPSLAVGPSLDRNVTDHAGGTLNLPSSSARKPASRASFCYDLRSPTGDDPPCHVADGSPAAGCSFFHPIMIHGGPPQGQYATPSRRTLARDPIFPVLVAIFALQGNLSSRSMQAPEDLILPPASPSAATENVASPAAADPVSVERRLNG